MSEARPIGNGDVHPLKELRVASDAELIAQHDERAAKTTAGVNHSPGDLARSEGDLNDQHMIRPTETMGRLTWLVAGLTVLNLIAAIVTAVAAIVVIDRGG